MTIIATPAVTTLDYDWLQARISDWLHRSDLDAQIPDFIMLAEQRLNRLARVRTMQVTAPLTLAAGERLVDLPADYKSPIRAWLTHVGDLSPAVPEQLPVTTTPGMPRYWAIDGESLAVDAPADTQYTVTLRYNAMFRLSGAYPVNTLLTNYPDLYLYGALLKSAPYVRDPQMIATWKGFFDAAVKEINANESRARGIAPLRTEFTALLGCTRNYTNGGA